MEKAFRAQDLVVKSYDDPGTVREAGLGRVKGYVGEEERKRKMCWEKPGMQNIYVLSS